MTASRRDIFKFLGGTAVGAVFTPVPWRLVTDLALWSENWPGIPRPVRGEIRAKFTNCALCPAGCAVRARCVGEQPISLAGAEHPLCPFGLTGHHLPYHPDRVKTGNAKKAAEAVAGRVAGGQKIAVLDLAPGRTASWTYRRALSTAKDGVYVVPPQPAAAFCPGAAKTVLSLSAPLLDGWGTPANAFASRANYRLIQADPVESRTAVLADRWLRINPGSDCTLALGILGALKPGEGISPAAAATAAGIPEQEVLALAGELQANGPALAIDAEGSQEVVALDVALGGWGRTTFPRREAPVPEAWRKAAPVAGLDSVPDGSVGVLLIDESAPGAYLPWRAIERKLVRENPLVVVFGWSKSGYGRHAQYLLPTAVYPEAVEDIPPALDCLAAAFRITAPLVSAPEGIVNPAEFISAALGFAAGEPLRERADAIHKSGRGTLVTYADAKSTAVKGMPADDFWKGLNSGGCWTDNTEEKAGPPPDRPNTGQEARATENLPLVAALAERFAAPVSPLLSKLYQESNLRLGPNRAALHPETARQCGIDKDGRAVLETAYGRCEIEVVVDRGVFPGTVALAATPEILDVCASGTRVKVVRA
jgi:hypothetical protein